MIRVSPHVLYFSFCFNSSSDTFIVSSNELDIESVTIIERVWSRKAKPEFKFSMKFCVTLRVLSAKQLKYCSDILIGTQAFHFAFIPRTTGFLTRKWKMWALTWSLVSSGSRTWLPCKPLLSVNILSNFILSTKIYNFSSCNLSILHDIRGDYLSGK